MTFADAIAALDEAKRYALDPQAVHRLAEACQRRRQLLRQESVLDHGVPYDPARWPAIPTTALGRITRSCSSRPAQAGHCGSWPLTSSVPYWCSAAGSPPAPPRYALWLTAFGLQAVSPFVVPVHSRVYGLSAFHLATAHFVERHGLLMIIALGESVVAIGMGVDVDRLTAGTVAVTALALALPAGLWWTYFTDNGVTETVLDGAETGPRVRMGVWMGYAHIPLLLGIVVAAVGIHSAVAHPGDPAPWSSALALGGGVAVFLVGMAAARRTLRTAPPRSRLVTAAVVLATVPIGTVTNGGLHLAVLVVVVGAMLVLDARPRTALRHEPEIG